MTEFIIKVEYGLKVYALKSVIEYNSDRIMRIRVYGNRASILFETNYPEVTGMFKKSNKALYWKIREGAEYLQNDTGAGWYKTIVYALKNKLKVEGI